MKKNETRLARELRTVEAMIRLYCRRMEGNSALCPQCAELLDYAGLRLKRCRYGEGKPTCKRCPVHCYAKVPREKMRRVMRYAGPRMLVFHPLMTLRHLADGWRASRHVQKW